MYTLVTDKTKSKKANLEVELLEQEKEIMQLKKKKLERQLEVLDLQYDVLQLQKEVCKIPLCQLKKLKAKSSLILLAAG